MSAGATCIVLYKMETIKFSTAYISLSVFLRDRTDNLTFDCSEKILFDSFIQSQVFLIREKYVK